MEKKCSFVVLVLLLVQLTNCNKIIFREIDCNAFELTEEYYWFSESVGASISFVDENNNILSFTIRDKTIEHRTQYKSDTGCGCLDESRMLMTSSNSDSIWLKVQSIYVEDQEATPIEDIVFVFNGTQTIFNETIRTQLNTYSIDSIEFEDVKKFEYNHTENNKVKTVYLAKNLGILKFERVDGTIWTNQNLVNLIAIEQSSFSYSENTCD